MLEKILARIRAVLPDRSELIVIVAAFALGTLVSVKGVSCQRVPEHPDSSNPPTAQSLVRLGKAYTANLGKVYASSWETGAAALEAGKPISSALDAVRDAWDRDRMALFNRSVAAEFAKVVPPGKADSEITAAEKTELAKAWRAFASGLRK